MCNTERGEASTFHLKSEYRTPLLICLSDTGIINANRCGIDEGSVPTLERVHLETWWLPVVLVASTVITVAILLFP